MRAYDIALFTFIFMFMMNMIYDLGVFDAGEKMEETWNQTDFERAYSDLNRTVQSTDQEIQESSPNYFFDSVKLAIQGMAAFTTAFVKATVLVPESLKFIIGNFGATETEAALIGYPLGAFIWLIYAVGIMQLASGRGIKDME